MFVRYLQEIQTVIAIMWVIFVILLSVYSIKLGIQMIRTKNFSARVLFKNFGQKMWMTAGIGLLFFGLYGVLVLYASRMMDQETRKNIFIFAYKHPIESIYLGLFVFVLASISIYLARMMIIYLYNRK